MRHKRPDIGGDAALPCSERYYQLERASKRELETVFLRGSQPDLDQLVGWQFRGCNHPTWAYAAGIKKFIKGFYRDHGEVFGYNCPVEQNGIKAPSAPKWKK